MGEEEVGTAVGAGALTLSAGEPVRASVGEAVEDAVVTLGLLLIRFGSEHGSLDFSSASLYFLSPRDEARNTEEGRAPAAMSLPSSADAPEPLPGRSPLLLPPVRALSFPRIRKLDCTAFSIDRSTSGEGLMSGLAPRDPAEDAAGRAEGGS